jgi:TP53 regulating kinase and related kinases
MLADQTFEAREGAEARIEIVQWRGEPAIRKIRVPKTYRSEALDNKLRIRRTKEEAQLLHTAKLARVDVPEILFADPESSEIIMEYVQGQLLTEIHERKLADEVYATLGEFAARLHSKGIIHGDLTTKNVIQSGTRTVLIDFGLAFVSDRLEDRAEDLHLLKQAIRSSSLSLRTAYFDRVLKGYEKEAGLRQSIRVKKQILEIEKRGRYARVD